MEMFLISAQSSLEYLKALPCLFLMYISDMPDNAKRNIRLLADDTIVEEKVFVSYSWLPYGIHPLCPNIGTDI